MRVLPGPTKSNQVLAWSPDGRFVAAGGSGDGVMAWDVPAGTPGRIVLPGRHGGRLMRFCPRTGRLYVAFQSGGFWYWDPSTDEERQLTAAYSIVYGLAVSDDGRSVATDVYNFPSGRRGARRSVVGYAVAGTGELAEAWARPGDKWDDRGSISFRPGTDELFGLGRHVGDELRFVWVRSSNRVAGSFAVPPEAGRVTRWALAPDSARVAWLTERGLYLRRLDDPATLELPAAEGELRRGLAFHPSGRTLAYTTGTTVRLLDADTLVEVRAFDWGTGKVRAVAFSPDGLRAAVSAEGGKGWVTVFDLE
ncbi:MAG: WD40 repeat domain-containing protein [Planctomycetes bacterium]|nr:WD40 repeat domain-containing protein [Planctomycetota bacterium]